MNKFPLCHGMESQVSINTQVLCLVPAPLATPSASAQQVWDVDRLIRARNPGAVFTTTERNTQVTWQTLRSGDNVCSHPTIICHHPRSITYSPTLGQGAVGSASVQEASLVRRWE